MKFRQLLFAVVAMSMFVMVSCDSNMKTETETENESVTQHRKGSSIPEKHPGDKSILDSAIEVLYKSEDRMIGVLPNRMILVTQKVDTAPVVSVNCFVKAGLIFQHDDAFIHGGISHYLEHLLSGGSTSTRTEAQNNEIIARTGGRPNAYTSSFEVNYYINGSNEDSAALVDLISDGLRNATLPMAEIEREKSVILRELDMGRGEPNRIFWKLTQQSRYLWHTAKHPTIGYEPAFLKITPDQLKDFYQRMYAPNNLTFVVVGDIDPVKVMNQIAQDWKKQATSELPEIKWPVEDAYDKDKLTIGYADIKLPRMRLMWPGTKLTEEHDYALDILGQILGQGELSRLTQSLRNEKQLVMSISAFNYSMVWGKGFFGVDADLPADKVDAAKAAIWAEIERIQQEGVTQEELDRAKRKVLARSVMAGQEATSYARNIATDIMTLGDPNYDKKYASSIQKITAEEVKTAAQLFLSADGYQQVMLYPATDENPVTVFEVEELERPADLKYETYDLDNRKVIAQMRENLNKASVDELAKVEVGEMKLHTLDNGLRVLIQRDTRLPMVAMRWYQLGGLLAEKPDEVGAGNATMSMLKRGAGGLSANEIYRKLEDLGASMNAAGGNNTWYIDATSLSSDYAEVLGLMGTILLEPDFPEDEWNKLKPRLVTGIQRRQDRWTTELIDGFRRYYYGEHPWSHPTVGEVDVVENLSAADLKKYHEDHLGAKDGIIAIFGDVDEAEALKQVKAIFGKMKPVPAISFTPPVLKEAPSGVKVLPTGKPNYAVQIGWGPIMTTTDESYAEMLIMSRVLDNFPVGWIDQALRGKEGLSYASWAFGSTGVVPGYWSVLYNTRPQSADEAYKRVIAAVDRIQAGPLDEDTFRKAQRAVLVSRSLGMQTLGDRATSAALSEIYGEGYQADKKLIERLNASTPKKVFEVTKYIFRNKPLKVILQQEGVKELGIYE